MNCLELVDVLIKVCYTFNNNFFSKETGGISQYDFNVSFNIEDRVYLGATLGVYDVNQ